MSAPAIAYEDFLKTKGARFEACGIEVQESDLPEPLYLFQRKLTRWALRKGKAALWCDTGLGKTFMQLAWASKIPGRVLIIAPLCVGRQTVREGKKLGIDVGAPKSDTRIQIINYEQLHNIVPEIYSGVVLDESSILKSVDGATRGRLIDMFQRTPYRLCCTATPAPNDVAELANHCEFLGIMSRTEMLATWFVHDETKWRLKHHGREGFYTWLASWGMFVRKPSDLGFSDDGYILPGLAIKEHIVTCEATPSGRTGIVGRFDARKGSIAERVDHVTNMVLDSDEQWILWCGLNEEQDRLARALKDCAVSIQGSDSSEEKEERLEQFLSGEARVLISKTRIVGFGLNMQNCSRMAFVGIGDSFESYYQAIRRCWRFGQKSKVEAHVIISEDERGTVENVKRKEADHNRTADGLVRAMRKAEMEEIGATVRQIDSLETHIERGDGWEMRLGDCVEELKAIPESSIDISVYSPPFLSLYTYSNSDRDMGNCRTKAEFLEHFGYAVREILRVTKLGRNTCVHVAQVASTLVTHGVIGLIDLRGAVIECYAQNGWTYHGDICIQKNPQAQAIRTHAKGLLFAQLKKDSSWLRPGLADYILVFRKPGENETPIHPDITNEDWIKWAHPVWFDIQESDTLNIRAARGDGDEKHMCPLQLGVIERCVRLWSNRGETVLSPFAGIGSEGYISLECQRKFIGIELKPEYFAEAVRNLNYAKIQPGLF